MIAALHPSGFSRADIQGNILRGYGRSRTRYLILEVLDASAARRWLGVAANGGDGTIPAITSDATWRCKPKTCFNIGITFEGLRALGTSALSLASFPSEFRQGMAASAIKLGDTGESAPERWLAPFRHRAAVHVIASIHADAPELIERTQQHVNLACGGKAFTVLSALDGWHFNADYVHFGYRDGFSQPRFAGIDNGPVQADQQPLTPLGSLLLGYPNELEGLMWDVPEPCVLGYNGSFSAFRILAQDVAAFEGYLDDMAKELCRGSLGEELLPKGSEGNIGPGLTRRAALREVVAAKLCGRWRNGIPLELSPSTPYPESGVSRTDFDYSDEARCPFGAHVRRCNPRGSNIVQRAAGHTRRLVRRGIPYGDAYDRENPDTKERGLLGNFICANLASQFEAVTCDWLNLGLQDPRITGTNDPMVGSNNPRMSWFEIPLESKRVIRLSGLPRFVSTKGGAYAFLPSMPAIRYLASL